MNYEKLGVDPITAGTLIYTAGKKGIEYQKGIEEKALAEYQKKQAGYLLSDIEKEKKYQRFMPNIDNETKNIFFWSGISAASLIMIYFITQ